MLSGEHSYLTLTYLDNTSSVWQPLFRLLAPDILCYVETDRVTGVYQVRIHVAHPSFFPVPFLLVHSCLSWHYPIYSKCSVLDAPLGIE
ncbi:hypothetical protein DQJ56_19895 [Salmonella enterica subsp. salamae serovar Sofia]|nr:hypothetical protein [Salmonella enterica subsp. salamae serovar Sofia]